MTGSVAGHVKRLIVCLAAVVTASLIQPVATAAPASVPPGGWGFGDGAQTMFLPQADLNRELDAVAATSATWLRVVVPWANIETAQGAYDWAQTDMVIDAAIARGLKVLGVIAFTPAWARQPGTFFTAPPDNSADYADFSAAVVTRYKARVSNWQLWNEPNLPLFFGYSVHNAPKYTDLVKLAYPAIKAVQPNSTVVLAGFSRLLGDESPQSFLKQMYDLGVKGSFDAAAAHPYVFPGGLSANPDNGWSDVAALHDVLTDNGDGAKKIWMTELGAPTCDCPDGVSQREQGKQILDVLAAVTATGYSGPAFVYSIRDTDTTNRGDRETNFGTLLTSDWQPKAAASLLAR